MTFSVAYPSLVKGERLGDPSQKIPNRYNYLLKHGERSRIQEPEVYLTSKKTARIISQRNQKNSEQEIQGSIQ